MICLSTIFENVPQCWNITDEAVVVEFDPAKCVQILNMFETEDISFLKYDYLNYYFIAKFEEYKEPYNNAVSLLFNDTG